MAASDDRHWLAEDIERLIDNGYHPIPIKPSDKAPGKFSCGQWIDLADWVRFGARQPTEREVAEWSAYPPCGVGIVTGNIVAFDIDILDDALSIRVEQLLRQMVGDTQAIRFGMRPKRLLVYRADKPFRSRRLGPVEILCEGRQFVAHGIHPKTQAPYDWGFESLAQIDRDSLPAVTEEQAQGFLDQVAGLLPPGARKSHLRETASAFAKSRAPIATLADAMAFVSPAEGQHYDDWLAMGMSLHEATGGNADAYDLWDAWSSRSSKHDPRKMTAKWSSFGKYPGERHGAGYIYDDARRNGWTTSLPLSEYEEAAAFVDISPFMAKFIAASRASQTEAPPSAPELEPVWTVPAGEPGWLRDLDGGLRMFVDHVRDQSHRDQPDLALAAALPVFGTLAGRRYQSTTGLLTNIYTVGLAHSGSGKEVAIRIGNDLLADSGEVGMIGGEDFASGSAIVSAVHANPSIFFATDEFGKMLASATNVRNAGSHEAAKLKVLLTMYSASQRTYMGVVRADREANKQKIIARPCLSFYGPTAPQSFWEALSSLTATDGTLGRMVAFTSKCNYPDQVRTRYKDIPVELVEIAKRVSDGANGHNTFPLGIGPDQRPNPFTVEMEPGALACDDEMMAEITRLQREHEGSKANAIYARAIENIIKVAMIRAVSTRPGRPSISKADYIWARDLVMERVEDVVTGIEINVADNEQEAMSKRVLRVIAGGGSGGVSQSQLTRATQTLDKRRRDSIISDLIGAELVQAVAVGSGGGRTATYYYAI